ncbi:MAG: 2-hydroxyacid dehydrogenase, partial [Ferruginibacter sp.]|nr:2-hydroxyacid dehydrogenase [Ferruginibacter sp.]
MTNPTANKITFFSTQAYDKQFFSECNTPFGFELDYFETQLNATTANLVQEGSVVCVFVNDKVDANVVKQLAAKKVTIIALRCAGFNNVDVEACR